MLAEFGDEIRQGVSEVLVFAATEAITAHVDAAAEAGGVRVEVTEAAAFGFREQLRQEGESLTIQGLFGGGPVEGGETGGNVHIPTLRAMAGGQPSGTCVGIQKKNSRREQNKGGGRTSM